MCSDRLIRRRLKKDQVCTRDPVQDDPCTELVSETAGGADAHSSIDYCAEYISGGR